MKIQIFGTAAEGKTSISNLIHDLLKSHGFEVSLTDEDMVEDYTPRLRQLRERGLKIEIETIQIKKDVKIQSLG